MTEFLTNNWQILLAAIGLSGSGGAIGIYFDRKKRKADAKQSEGNALQTMQKAYDVFVEDSKSKIDEIKAELKDIKQENREQRKTLRVLQTDNARMHKQISDLSKENTELRAVVARLELENKELLLQLKKYKA